MEIDHRFFDQTRTYSGAFSVVEDHPVVEKPAVQNEETHLT